MARPVSITKDKILAAALDVVRKGGASALTARSLSSALGCGANAIFSAYGSMEGILSAVKSEARKSFRERISEGFSLNPPFKGFGLALLWFAMDEPQLYKIVMEEKVSAMSIEDYIEAHLGFKEESVAAISQSFNLQEKNAEMLYYQIADRRVIQASERRPVRHIASLEGVAITLVGEGSGHVGNGNGIPDFGNHLGSPRQVRSHQG